MIHQLYKKQVEAWKEKAGQTLDDVYTHEITIAEGVDVLNSSRHKDTIELIEAEIERKRKMRTEVSDEPTVAVLDNAYNSAIDEDIAYLEEQLTLLKNER